MEKSKIKSILSWIRFILIFCTGWFVIGFLNNRYSPNKASGLAVLCMFVWITISILLSFFESEDFVKEELVELKELNWKKFKRDEKEKE